jgi:hypothetical protein
MTEQIRPDRELLAAAPKDSDDWDNATWAAWWRTVERHDPHLKRKVTAAAAAAQGALPPPVGDQPQPLDDARLAEIRDRSAKRAAALTAWLNKFSPLPEGQREVENAETVLEEDVPALLAAVTYHRYWEQVGWQKAHAYNELWGRADDRLAEERQLVARLRKELSRQGRAHKAEVERLKAALSEATDQVAELESDLAEAHQKKTAALASARQLMNRNRTEEAS